SARNWPAFSATSSFDTQDLASTLITKVIKRQRNTNCLDRIRTQLLLDVGIYTGPSGGSDTYISRETNTTGFRLADKESGLRESASLKGNHWLQARPVYGSLLIEAHW